MCCCKRVLHLLLNCIIWLGFVFFTGLVFALAMDMYSMACTKWVVTVGKYSGSVDCIRFGWIGF